MSVKKNRPSREEAVDSLIQAIVAELNADQENSVAQAPEIIEDYQTFSDRFSVRVIWEKWQGVPPAERVPMILEAYRRSARKDDVPNITSVRGLTSPEALYEKMTAGLLGDTQALMQKAFRNI